MLSSMKAIMTELIDYAGLFPPAKLPLKIAANHFADYMNGSYAWALSRFVCPAAKLTELNELAISATKINGDAKPRWPISVLGSPSDSPAAFLEQALADSKFVKTVHETTDAILLMDALETKLPSLSLYEDQSSSLTDDLLQLAKTWLTVAKAQSISQFSIFLELSSGDDWQRDVEQLASVTAACNRQLASANDGITIGLKIRTGGIQASAIPAIADVATFISLCKQHSVPFKATAGLHHPVRHHSSEVSAKMHGFLNVFGAASLVFANDLTVDDLQAILSEESADQFAFSQAGFGWRDHHISVDQIKAMRDQCAMSFGSCSFTEPIEDLQKLGLLPTTSKA